MGRRKFKNNLRDLKKSLIFVKQKPQKKLMNYLLFVYYDSTVEDSDLKTQEIGTKLAEHMTSGQIKFMYGEKHAIFHFGCKGEFNDVSDVLYFLTEEISGYEYFLTKKGRDYSSNFDEDNLNHLMSLKDTKPKQQKSKTPKFKPNDLEMGEKFMDIADLILNFKKPNVCNLTLDELLDKISSDGMGSLSDVEKQKLEEYSKSL